MQLFNARSLATALLALLLGTQAVAAPSKTGADLAGQCVLTSNLAVIVCHVYIHAVQDVLEDNQVDGFRACLPDEADIDFSVKVFVDWVATHPDEGNGPASGVVAHALSSTYPCT